MSRVAQVLLLALKEVTAHVIRRWYIYATILVFGFAPFGVMLVVALGWLGFFCYKLTRTERDDILSP